jgi:hypothetical protein
MMSAGVAPAAAGVAPAATAASASSAVASAAVVASAVTETSTINTTISNASETVLAAPAKQKGYVNNNLDIISLEDMNLFTSWSAVVAGDRLLVGERDRSGIRIYNAETYEYLETVEIDGVSVIYNMAVNGNDLYIASNTTTINVVNLSNMTRSNTIQNRETNVLHIAYSPDLDGGMGGLYYGNAENLFSCNRMGLKRDTIFMNSVDFVLSGTAYYDGALYMFSQTGSMYAQLLKFDVDAETVVWTKELIDYPRIASMDASGFLPVGLTLCVLPDSTIALGGMFGCYSKTNHFALFELVASPSIEGYNLYRNDVKLNDEPIKGHFYQEEIFSAGTYTYTIEAINTNGCRAMLSDVQTTVTIEPIGVCEGPHNLTVSESAHSAVLNWEIPDGQSGLVGFNVYRNGDKVADKITDDKYLDFNVDTGYYVYVVESFYQNSCVAADTVEIVVRNEGEVMPPQNLAATSEVVDLNANGGEGEFNVGLVWDLPYFENPLAIGFSNLPYYGIVLQNNTPIWAAIGWTAEQLVGYEDLYVVGMEYFIGEGVISLDGFVFLNDTLVYMKRAEDGVSENNWNTVLFDRAFSMDQPIEVAVGYKVTYENTESVAVVDFGPKKGYSDLLSGDGVQWSNLQSNGLDNNWCINALVVRKRDLEGIDGVVDARSPLVRRIGGGASSVDAVGGGVGVSGDGGGVAAVCGGVYDGGAFDVATAVADVISAAASVTPVVAPDATAHLPATVPATASATMPATMLATTPVTMLATASASAVAPASASVVVPAPASAIAPATTFATMPAIASATVPPAPAIIIATPPAAPATAFANKATSSSIRLDGFNIYKNNVKQNDAPQTTLYYNDSSITGGNYSYRVSAVYNEGAEEALSEPIIINLRGSGLGIAESRTKEIQISAYPNPANKVFYINGDYKSLQIVDMAGTVVKKYSHRAKTINISDLQTGTYLLRFVLPNSTVKTGKLVVK